MVIFFIGIIIMLASAMLLACTDKDAFLYAIILGLILTAIGCGIIFSDTKEERLNEDSAPVQTESVEYEGFSVRSEEEFIVEYETSDGTYHTIRIPEGTVVFPGPDLTIAREKN